MSETHSLQLKIDAAPAQAGAKQFTAAIAAVKNAVKDLDRDTSGAFTKLRNIKPQIDTTSIKRASTDANTLTTALTGAGTASTKMASTTQSAALSASMALRQASTSAQKLAFRLGDLGDTSSIDKLDAGLNRLHANLQRAPDVAAVRVARSAYEDLRVELTQTATAAEYAKGSLAQVERESRTAAAAADQHASSLERLRREFLPLYSASKDYEAALERISQAERESILSADQASAARERAATGLMTAGRGADTFAGQMRGSAHAAQQVGFQLNDIGVMLAGGMSPLAIATGQGTQLAQTFSTLGSRAEILSTLRAGFMQMVSPISLVTIGAIALGGVLYYALSKAIPQAKSLKDALAELDASLNRAKASTDLANDLDAIAAKYGNTAKEVMNLVNARRELDLMDSRRDLNTARDSIYSETANVDAWEALAGYADTAQGRVRAMRDQLDLSADEAARLEGIMQRLRTETDATVLSDLAGQARNLISEAAGGLDKLNAGQETWVRGLTEVEDTARRYIAIDMAAPVAAATGQTQSWLGSMQAVQGAAQNVLNTLQALSGLKINISTPTVTTTTTPKTTAVGAPAPREADSSLGRITNIQDVAYQVTPTPAATTTTSAITTTTQAIVSATMERTAALQVEGSAAESVTVTLQDRLSSLEAERIALGLVASGQVATADAASLMAESMVKSGGMVDAQTESMIRQIDVATRLNEELRKVATDPVREWMMSVPSWIEAGQQIEMGAIDSLKTTIADFIKTGKFDFESLGEAVLGVFADIVSDKAVAELANLLGRGDGQGLGGLFGGLFASVGDAPVTGDNGAAVASGGMQAGTSISTAMVTAGQTVSAQIANAMTTGGASVQAGAQSGLTAGAAQVRTAGQAGLAIGANNVRIAGSTSGQLMGQGVVTGSQQGASILASGVASGAAGGAGGGILSGLGGIGGVLGMVLGAFSEGGVSTNPVGSAVVPMAAFRHAPSYANGTANTSGIPAVLHPNESVVPLTRGRKIPVDLGDSAGGTVIHQPQTFNITTPDVEGMRRSQGQIAAAMSMAGAKAARKNG